MSKRKNLKGAIDKIGKSMHPDDLNKELDKASKMLDVELSSDKPKGKKYSLADAKPPAEKPDKKKRKPFTMMLRPDLRTLLDNIAQNNDISLSQVVEDILKEYFEIKD